MRWWCWLGCPDLHNIQPCKLLFRTVMYGYHMDQNHKKNYLYIYLLIEASLTIQSIKLLKLTPWYFAISGTKEVGVIPGWVLISNIKKIPDLLSKIKSDLVMPLQFNTLWALRPNSFTSLILFASILGGIICLVAPLSKYFD